MSVRSDSRPVASSAAELIAGATSRVPLQHTDGKSAVPMDRVVIDGASYVTKAISTRFDWISRATGDYGCRVLGCWRDGILDQLPGCFDHAIVAVSYEPETSTTTLLMHDVGEWLVPEGDDPISLEQHRRFIDHMAQLHAAFWGRSDLPLLTPMTARYLALTPLTSQTEHELGNDSGVPAMLPGFWHDLDAAAPDAARVARALIADPWPLVAALNETPQTFIHGDWKMGNLGSHPDGRTILIDWQWPGVGPATVDLVWYLAINAARLPESKEAAIDAYREALERHRVVTDGWFERQLDLAILGGFVQLGWNKAGDPAELSWWTERVAATAETLP
ncbi:MAG TPA: phosphotransferase [Mycobacteriales bacterium]|nr:phosphotransferase [Mycobacteriales bacterium]